MTWKLVYWLGWVGSYLFGWYCRGKAIQTIVAMRENEIRKRQ